jgi:RecB family exonuclease
VQIPEHDGRMTVSPTMLRTYGAGGFRLTEHEGERGCPRQFKAKYVERRVADDGRSDALAYGSLFHRALYLMDEEQLTPEQALERVWPVRMDPAFWAEARRDLTAYLERGASPTDRYGTIAVEQELSAHLYDDEDFGPVWIRAILDWLGVDLDAPGVLHAVDYKTNRHPPSVADVRGDIQLKIQHLVVRENAARYGMHDPRVVMHLDAVKWREVEVSYTQEEIEDLRTWLIAVVRAILRDDEALPVLNPGCGWCPVRGDCPAYTALPEVAEQARGMLAMLDGDEARLAWRSKANKVRLLLAKAVEDVDKTFERRARENGGLRVGDTEWAVETDWATEIDMRRLHEAMGESFYDVASTSKTRVEAAAANWPASTMAAVRACFGRVPTGTKVVRRKVSGG